MGVGVGEGVVGFGDGDGDGGEDQEWDRVGRGELGCDEPWELPG